MRTSTSSADEPTSSVTTGCRAEASAQRTLPLVSIVTPSYNQGKFLRRTIESVLGQTYPNIDYMVMDGGSKDESVEILRSYGDRFPWVSEPDGGQTHAINKGLARARGQILAYLNSDDILLPDAVEKVVAHFARNPGLDLVYGDADYIDVDGRVTHRYASDAYSMRRLMRDCMVCQPAAFWTRRIVEKVGLFDETAQWAMDYEYWLRIAKAGAAIEFVPEVIAQSRLYAETKTKSGRDKIFREVFRVCKKHGGYVHLNYCHGYLDFLVRERKSRLWTRLASTDVALCRWSRYFCLFKNVGLFGMPGAFFKQRVFLLEQRPERAGPLLRNPLAWRVVRRFRRVHGVSSDGWLCDCVRFHAPRKEPASRPAEWWFSGVPTRDMEVTVHANGRLRHRHALRCGQPVRIAFAMDPVGAADVRIQFSDYSVDRAWRKLSFHLHGSSFLRTGALDEALYGALPYLA